MDDETARTLEHLAAGVLAAEDWAPGYGNAPKQHAAMIKQGAHLQRLTLQYLKDLANDSGKLVDWYQYSRARFEQERAFQASASNIIAYDVNVIVNNNALNAQDQQFISVVFDTVATIAALGADSTEEEFGIPVGLSSTSELIQNLTTDQLANLVGMKVDKATGLIVPNPNPAYNIDNTTRNKIANSIKTSIRLGENQDKAAARLFKVIADPLRADMIAYTETVRAYASGRHAYGEQSGATGKYWSDSNAIDICSDNTAQGIIPFSADFVSGDPYEPAHVNCKCLTTLVYGDVQFDG